MQRHNFLLKRTFKYVLFALSSPLLFGVIFQDVIQQFVDQNVIPVVSAFQINLRVWLTSSLLSIIAATGTTFLF